VPDRPGWPGPASDRQQRPRMRTARPSQPPSQPVPSLLFSLLSIFLSDAHGPLVIPELGTETCTHTAPSQTNSHKDRMLPFDFPCFPPPIKSLAPPSSSSFPKIRNPSPSRALPPPPDSIERGLEVVVTPSPLLTPARFPSLYRAPSSFLFSRRAASTGGFLAGAAAAPSPPSIDRCQTGMREGLLRRPP
jgi:hypothetical protein